MAEEKLILFCSKSHITYWFDLDKNVDRINISFSRACVQAFAKARPVHN